MYSIHHDSGAHRVILTFSGTMDQDPQVFLKELTDAARAARGSSPHWDMLVDFSQTPVMPQDRAENTAKIFDWCLQHGIRKVAFVMSSVLQRMQVRRLTAQNDKVDFFETRSQGELWLDS